MQSSQQLQQPTLGQLAEELKENCQTCEICHKFFKKLSHFNRHMHERHTQSRDYVCREQDCGKTFKRGSHLKRHMISHTNIKSFRCNYCCMSFGYKHHLDRHTKVIHFSQRIECVQCNLKFKKKKAFTKHIEKVHTPKVKRPLKKKASVEDSKIIDYTITKIGLEQSMKNDDIYESDSDSELNCAKSEKLLYRCHHNDCLSAFERLSDFKRHLSHLHLEIEV